MGDRNRMNTGDSAGFRLPPNRPDGLANGPERSSRTSAEDPTRIIRSFSGAGWRARGGKEGLEDFVGQ